jgi:hypothetical protein
VLAGAPSRGIRSVSKGSDPRGACGDYLEAKHISWTVWNFSADWAPPLLKDDRTFEPSPGEGAYFKGRLLALNGPPLP